MAKRFFLLPFQLLWWSATLQLGRRIRLRRDYRLVAGSGIFDAGFYLRQGGDVAKTGVDPLRDYLTKGGLEGRDPHPLFDGDWYLQQNPEAAASRSNPLVHYLRQGWRQRRNPHPLFDTAFYLDQNPDVAQAEIDPLSHYLTQGGSEGRDPHPLFDTEWYLRLYPDAIAAGGTALGHYLQTEPVELRRPHRLFEPEFYATKYPDAVASGMHPLLHYVIVGAKQRHSPHPLFDVEFYLDQSPSLENSGVDLLSHYLYEGAKNGLDPCELFYSRFYLEQYPRVAKVGLNPLAHYWTEGVSEHCNPNPLFDTNFYLEQYPGIAAAGVNPLLDFIEYGAQEGRFPNPFFDPLFYLQKNPDVKRAGANPLAHYLKRGANEGRDPSPFFKTSAYISAHPELSDSSINPLAHFLRASSEDDLIASEPILVLRFNRPSSIREGPRPIIDLLLDLTDSETRPGYIRDFLRQLFSPEDLGGLITSATVLLPTRMPESEITGLPDWRFLPAAKPIVAANDAIKHALDGGSHLLVLLGPVLPGRHAVENLQCAFDIDPHFGVAVPRQSDSTTGDLLPLSDQSDDPALYALPQKLLPYIPEHYIVTEVLSSCFLLRNSLLSNFDLPKNSYQTLPGAFQEYLCRARRCGFRSVVLNRAGFSRNANSGAALIPVTGADLYRVHTEHPDIGRAKVEFLEHSLHLHERLLAQSIRQTLLVDCRGIPSHVDGTAEAVLGLCEGLRKLDRKWAITLLAAPDPAKFHRISERYPDWELINEPGGRCFTASLRASQPWDLRSMMDLHRAALFNFYMMLDTIAWDILFVAPRGLGSAWDFLSAYADGILYISQYTRDRFLTRFPLSRETPAYVSHLSFDPDDYKVRDIEANITTDDDFLLVVGNSYDHKNVGPTVDLLAAAFPTQRIKALGLTSHKSSRVDPLASGRISQVDVDRLFAQAKVIVFPSFYEGFGFPVLKGLSNGRTVIARDSGLLIEIASHYQGPGRLVSFRTRSELIDLVGKAMHDPDLASIPLGAFSGVGKPIGWKEVAAGVLRFLEAQVQNLDRCRWPARERAIKQLKAYSG